MGGYGASVFCNKIDSNKERRDLASLALVQIGNADATDLEK